jgi:hypothetical protein
MGWCAVILAGPGCDEADLQRGKPLIQVDPQALAYGALNVGDSGQIGLDIRNTGTAALTIDSVSIEGDAEFEILALDDQPFETGSVPFGLATAGAGTSQRQLELGFAPDDFSEYAAELVILSNADNAPELRLPLSGKGSVADIEVNPSRLDFGGVGLNSSASLTLTIVNVGDAPLRIVMADLALESGDAASAFFWIGQDMNLPYGGRDTLEVIYAPKQVQVGPDGLVIPDSDALLLHSNDPDENPVRIELSGFVSDNLPPLTAVKLVEVTKLDGTPLADVCAPAPVDTIRFEGRALDPEGEPIQGGNLRWRVESKPSGSTRDMQVPAIEQDRFWPSFKPDLSGDYVVCLSASDPLGARGSYDVDAACDCQTANAAEDFSCPCVRFSAFPREDIRVELTWDILGPDLDLHLVAPSGQYCSPTRECRYDTMNPDNPDWTRTACVDSGAMTTCRTPNCDPVASGCLAGQECYDSGAGPECWWQTCSGTDCYWNARRPDWGVPGDTRDDPVLAIDCTGQCRAENINLNNPVPGIYTIMVNYYEFRGNTTARIRVYFKGDVVPSAEFEALMTQTCDRWNVALIDWRDHDDHPITALGDSHSLACCD